MPARKEHRSDKMPSELERDAKCQMEPLLAGALINRLSNIDLLRLNGWLDMERRAAADELWDRHKDTIASHAKLLAALTEIRCIIEDGSRWIEEGDAGNLHSIVADAIAKAE